jgi:hypothetical protein
MAGQSPRTLQRPIDPDIPADRQGRVQQNLLPKDDGLTILGLASALAPRSRVYRGPKREAAFGLLRNRPSPRTEYKPLDDRTAPQPKIASNSPAERQKCARDHIVLP